MIWAKHRVTDKSIMTYLNYILLMMYTNYMSIMIYKLYVNNNIYINYVSIMIHNHVLLAHNYASL